MDRTSRQKEDRGEAMNDTPILLTAAISGTGGVIKTRPEDFFVEELPLYPAAGEGDHTYILIEKRGLGTRDAIDRLAKVDARKAEVAQMRLLWGLTVAEIGTSLGVSRATVERDWAYARAWLQRELA